MRYQTAPRPEGASILGEFPSGHIANICSMLDGPHTLRCGSCGEHKPANDFAWRRKARGQRDNMCRPCRADYKRAHYLANRQRYIDQAAVQKRRLRLERTLYLLKYFKANPC